MASTLIRDGNIAKPIWLWGLDTSLRLGLFWLGWKHRQADMALGTKVTCFPVLQSAVQDGNIAKPIWLWGLEFNHRDHIPNDRWKHRQADMALGTSPLLVLRMHTSFQMETSPSRYGFGDVISLGLTMAE